MTALRLLLATIVAACLAGVIVRGEYDGVTVLGLAATAGLLATYGFFTKRFWMHPEQPPTRRR